MRIRSILAGRITVVPETEEAGAGYRWVVLVKPNAATDDQTVKSFKGEVAFATSGDAEDEAAWQAELIAEAMIDLPN